MRKLILPMAAIALFSCQKESDQLTPIFLSIKAQKILLYMKTIQNRKM